MGRIDTIAVVLCAEERVLRFYLKIWSSHFPQKLAAYIPCYDKVIWSVRFKGTFPGVCPHTLKKMICWHKPTCFTRKENASREPSTAKALTVSWDQLHYGSPYSAAEGAEGSYLDSKHFKSEPLSVERKKKYYILKQHVFLSLSRGSSLYSVHWRKHFEYILFLCREENDPFLGAFPPLRGPLRGYNQWSSDEWLQGGYVKACSKDQSAGWCWKIFKGGYLNCCSALPVPFYGDVFSLPNTSTCQPPGGRRNKACLVDSLS